MLPFRNLLRHPGRSAALTVIVLFLSLALFGGSCVVLSLRQGLTSLESRLGADIVVVPTQAKSKVNLDEILLQGTTGYFYMSRSKMDEVAAREGIDRISGQVFLASLRADCCSIPVQVIGFDPATDFSILPWIRESSGKIPDKGEVVVGSKVSTGVGERLKIYGVSCPVVARLEETGTGLDTAVYCTIDTIAELIAAKEEMGIDNVMTGAPDQVVSCIYIRVMDGYDVDEVANDINLHVRKVKAAKTRSMFSGIADSLSGIARTVTILILCIWVLCLIILMVAFGMIIRERRREFAVLRMVGMSRQSVMGMILSESLLLSLTGAVLGICLSLLILIPFNSAIEQALGMPFLRPSLGMLTGIGALTLGLSLITGMISSAVAAWKGTGRDIGTGLREEA